LVSGDLRIYVLEFIILPFGVGTPLGRGGLDGKADPISSLKQAKCDCNGRENGYWLPVLHRRLEGPLEDCFDRLFV